MTTEAEKGAIGRVEQRLDEVLTLVNDLRERFAHMEGRAVDRSVEALRSELTTALARISVLEAAENIRNGQMQASKTWGEWIHRLAPWLFAVGLVVWNYLKPPV